jgi:hypothetical protein
LCETLQSHKATTRMAKQLLGQDRDKIDLWRAFARLERNAGNVSSARTVYKSLVSSGSLQSSSSNLDYVWAEWSELEWEVGEDVAALQVLILAAQCRLRQTDQESVGKVNKDSVSSTMDILRTRHAYEQLLLQLNSSSSLVFCASLFQYLSQDSEEAFEAAMKVYNNAMEGQMGESEYKQEVALGHCKFVWRHIKGDCSRSRVYVPKDTTIQVCPRIPSQFHLRVLVGRF